RCRSIGQDVTEQTGAAVSRGAPAAPMSRFRSSYACRDQYVCRIGIVGEHAQRLGSQCHGNTQGVRKLISAWRRRTNVTRFARAIHRLRLIPISTVSEESAKVLVP